MQGFIAREEDSSLLDHRSPFFWEFLSRYWWATRFTDKRRVLDLSCGAGFGSYILAQNSTQVIGLDTAPEAIHFARSHFRLRNLEFHREEFLSKKINADCFDVITAFEFLHRLSPQESAAFLRNAKAALVPEGILLVSTLNKNVVKQSGMLLPKNCQQSFSPKEFQATLAEVFPHVEILGQFHGRSYINQILFNLDVLNLRHRLQGLARKFLSSPSGAIEKQEAEMDGPDLLEIIPLLTRFPKQAAQYRFSRWHWRQAGHTVAICRLKPASS